MLFVVIVLFQQLVQVLEGVFIVRVVLERVIVAFLLRTLLFIWGFVRCSSSKHALAPVLT